MRIFLTGGSGFVGQHVIRQLRAEGHTVLALARSTASARTVTDAGAEPVRGDLAELSGRSPAVWLDRLRDVEAVVHAAARMEFWGPDDGFRTDNHEPTVALHAAAAQAGVSRFVLISAAGVSIGSQRATVVDENTDNGTPNIAYSRVKLATENALRSVTTPGMSLVILRPPFIWGSGLTTIADAVEAAKKGQWMWIDGGRHLMDYVHVDNLADTVVLSLTRGRDGGVYYITDGNPMPVRDFFTALLDTQGVDIAGSRSIPLAIAAPLAAIMDGTARLLRRRTPPPLTNWLIATMGRDRIYDISAARADLGYQPRVSLDAGMLEMAR
ncbi:NAD-dependent epimerase/dehydratase family protein [Mycolicibacterium wolinskyi]|uniref:Epimerase n=1 Tax=Mycolicibacterium wolinskyi TaxID=59750 RepID=A0A1X2F7R5_9MYCO|nr:MULTISPECIES: NAD-dependent epimerase/dehydratase family protein [Mycolicibacterium]MCV7286880.1 NAD-dependent epimerase/dehydratase family protein [Mycolicibacterium wolinskyi]MCV7293861.1 NAD-dependent epimerase/dehydratase family protein [Mycolicibacterium goodii]ORX14444.1 epimerase [Mycolicibacterium wolinskyi]